MTIDAVVQSKFFKGFIFGLLAFLILIFIFKVGEVVGIKKANFSYQWSNNYHQNFGGPKQGFLQGFGDKDFIEANGVVGQVIKTTEDSLTVKGRGDIEKVVLIGQDTTIKKLQENVNVDQIQIDEMVVIIGEPNEQGQIEAKLIRIMPEPPIGGVLPKRILR